MGCPGYQPRRCRGLCGTGTSISTGRAGRAGDDQSAHRGPVTLLCLGGLRGPSAREPLNPHTPKPSMIATSGASCAVHAGGRVRDIALIELLAGTGLRVGEALALQVGDLQISDRSGRVMVRLSKGGGMRRVPLTVEVRHALTAISRRSRRLWHQPPCSGRANAGHCSTALRDTPGSPTCTYEI